MSFSGSSAPTGVELLVTLDDAMTATGGTIGGDWSVDLLGLGVLIGRLQVTTEAAAVPEPGTLGLLGAGLIGLLLRTPPAAQARRVTLPPED